MRLTIGFCVYPSPFKLRLCCLRVLAESRSLSTLIGLTPWQPKATSKAKGIIPAWRELGYSGRFTLLRFTRYGYVRTLTKRFGATRPSSSMMPIPMK